MRHHYVSFALKDHRVYKLLMVVLSISRYQPATLPVAVDYLFSARVFMEHTNNKKGPSTRGERVILNYCPRLECDNQGQACA